MSPDEITNLIENEAGDCYGDPGQPVKAMFCKIAAEMAATTGPHHSSPTHETN
jgi:hypothetical protein